MLNAIELAGFQEELIQSDWKSCEESWRQDFTLEDFDYFLQWLVKYGYLAVDFMKGDVIPAIKAFQRFYGIVVDGVMGPKSMRAMHTPRCCFPDVLPEREMLKMQQNQGNVWGKNTIKWMFSKGVGGISADEQQEMFQQAADFWSEVCDVRFVQVGSSDHPDLKVTAARGRRYNLDGRGGTLAYTYLRSGWDPQQRGPIPIVFDLDENWSSSPNGVGIYYLAVACHELGHCGPNLTHSQIDSALMAAFYRASVFKPVQPDDHSRAQQTFGVPTQSPTPPPVQPPNQPPVNPPQEQTIVITLKQDVVKSVEVN